jgi:hypothetical protein
VSNRVVVPLFVIGFLLLLAYGVYVQKLIWQGL